MNKAIEDEIELVLKSLIKIKETAKNDILNSTIREEQSTRIDKLLQDFKEGYSFVKAYHLSNENFGGSFGMLIEQMNYPKAEPRGITSPQQV